MEFIAPLDPGWEAALAPQAAAFEQVGERLRAMMPWISKGKMVDRARN